MHDYYKSGVNDSTIKYIVKEVYKDFNVNEIEEQDLKDFLNFCRTVE